MKCNPHYHFIDLPNGRRVRTNKDCHLEGFDTFEDEELGTGWSFGKMRVTTSDVKALRNAINSYVDANGQPSWSDTWLATHGNAKEAANIQANAFKLLKDDELAAEQWSRLTRDQRNWLRNKFNKKTGLLRDIGAAATSVGGSLVGGLVGGPLGSLVGAKLGAKEGKKLTGSSLASNLLSKATPIATGMAGTLLGGPAGGALGSSLGSAFGGDTASQIQDVLSKAGIAPDIIHSVIQNGKTGAALNNLVTSVPKKVTKDVIASLQKSANKKAASAKAVNNIVTDVSKQFTPQLTAALGILKTNQIQQQATQEHKAIVKNNQRDTMRKNILDKLVALDKKVASMNADNKHIISRLGQARNTAAVFGVPARML